jgi:hypothetical protein
MKNAKMAKYDSDQGIGKADQQEPGTGWGGCASPKLHPAEKLN